MKYWNVRSGAPYIYFSVKVTGVKFGGTRRSIAFVWSPNAVGWPRQGWELRDRGIVNLEKKSLYKRGGT